MTNTHIVLDIGNTVGKMALFVGDTIENVWYGEDILSLLAQIPQDVQVHRGIFSSVRILSPQDREALRDCGIDMLELTSETPLPIEVSYETPKTLGADRIAAAVGAHGEKPGVPLLVIDAGTAITYEYVTADGRYLGGNISPGVRLRFEALHAYTSRLPLVQKEGRELDFGVDTDTAIRAGVLRGVAFEIEGYIREVQKKHPNLFVFLTGGEHFSFESSVKKCIFADRFLVLKGLNRILYYNQ